MITLATLPQATAQEVFDQVKNHLLSQGRKSSNGKTCFYHYKNPIEYKCAAGCLIGKNEYKNTFEKKSWNQLIVAGEVPSDHECLIKCLQTIHDNVEINMWPIYLKELANKFELKY